MADESLGHAVAHEAERRKSIRAELRAKYEGSTE
jgi:hypothetical protein